MIPLLNYLKLSALRRREITQRLKTNPVLQRARRIMRPAWFGTMRRLTPMSASYGSERGVPVDRYYIDQFLAAHASDIRGRVLEVKDSGYTERFGGGVTHGDVLDIDPSNPKATVIADLSAATNIPDNTYDCFILTQTLNLIYDAAGALVHAHRILRPGGTLLLTVPVVSQIVRSPKLRGDYWRFTPDGCAVLLGGLFGVDQVTVSGRGNLLASLAFLGGLAADDLSRAELAVNDSIHPLVVTVRAVKASSSPIQ